jgi:hypothetical protein
MHKTLLLTLCLSVSLAPCARAWTPPGDNELQSLLAGSAGLAQMLDGASPAQAASVLASAVKKVDAAGLSEPQRQQVVAELAARAVLAMGDSAPAMLASLVSAVDRRWLATIVAASVTAAPGHSDALLAAVTVSLGGTSGDAAAVRNAAANPRAILGAGLVTLLEQLVLSPPGGGRLPLSQFSKPPPVTTRYSGQ